ncbi:sigma-70 family RNA polymerase sigma factor [Mycolicibacterium palauense]|uniref:sigma-70 family RNA polymerase sigma factor n=1 Tax=Mycolicibacterium palauense TaxID=2034511 RepID=UPI000BFEC76A|nr:sigma-70 family RNA polymerase sigma factor [Mycolicibacterium palauense]
MTGSDRRPPRQDDGTDRGVLLRAVHDAHAQPLLRYVLKLTRGDMPFAEDVVQESLLRLWRKPEMLEQPTEAVRAWLFTVARNQVIDDRRSARYARELKTEVLPEQPTPDGTGPAFDKLIVAEALKTLTHDHRTVLVRAYYLGQTVADIAEHERIPPGTVKSRLHYGLRALRNTLQERGVVQ